MTKSLQQQIESLRGEIRHHDYQYYILAQPEISDQRYDELFAQLKKLEVEHPELITPDSPTQRVSGRPLTEFKTVTHAQPMLSMDNTYSPEELRQFDQRVRKNLNTGDYQYAVEAKIDGIAVSLTYEDGLLTLGATRGDGTQGDDITANIRTIASIPLKLTIGQMESQPSDGMLFADSDKLETFEVRGEVFMSHSQFQRINLQRKKQDQQLFANPRNATAGSLKLLDSSIVAQRGLQFYAYALGPTSSPLAQTHSGNLEKLKELSIPINPTCQIASNIEAAIEICQEWEQERRSRQDYPIDGMVIKVNSLARQAMLGATSRSPKWCIAYKFAAEQGESKITSIAVQVGKTGALTPVANLEPIALAGTTVSRASLHNFDEVARKDIREGDTVVVEKAGEIIPQVVSVNLAKRPAASVPLPLPRQCPKCQGAVAKDPDGVYIRCINPNCPAQLVERIKHFAGRSQMDIDGLGVAIIQQLVDKNIVKSFADLYRLDQQRLQSLERMGEKSAQNLVKAIEQSKAKPLVRVIAALGIVHVGSNIAEILASNFQSIDELLKASVEELQAIDEIGPQIAQSIYDFCNQDRTRQLIDDLIGAGLKMPSPKKSGNPQMLAGQTIVVTGSIEGYSRTGLQELIKAYGGKASSSVSKKTNLVVIGDNPGSKAQDAQKLDIPVMSGQEFIKQLKA